MPPRIKTRASSLARNNRHSSPSPDDTLISRKTLCARWGCSTETIRRRERAGQLHPILLSGRMLRYRLAEVIAAETNANVIRYKPQCEFGAKEQSHEHQ